MYIFKVCLFKIAICREKKVFYTSILVKPCWPAVLQRRDSNTKRDFIKKNLIVGKYPFDLVGPLHFVALVGIYYRTEVY